MILNTASYNLLASLHRVLKCRSMSIKACLSLSKNESLPNFSSDIIASNTWNRIMIGKGEGKTAVDVFKSSWLLDISMSKPRSSKLSLRRCSKLSPALSPAVCSWRYVYIHRFALESDRAISYCRGHKVAYEAYAKAVAMHLCHEQSSR